jgi:hypothetical protein
MPWKPVPLNISLCCWYLVYKVPIDKVLDREDELTATAHCKLKLALWDKSKLDWPNAHAKVLDKRSRRLAYAKVHGSCPDGVTPGTPEYFYPKETYFSKKSVLREVKKLCRLTRLVSVREKFVK